MSASELLGVSLQLFFIVLGGITLRDYLQHRSDSRRDIALLFGSLALTFMIQVTMRLIQDEPFWMRVVSSCALTAQPYLILRLGRYFHPVSPRTMKVTFVVMLILWTALALSQHFTTINGLIALLALVAYFVVINAYGMWIFVQGARMNYGILRYRLRFIATGSGLIALAIAFVGMAVLIPVAQEFFGLMMLIAAVTCALAYYAGFATPRWLIQAWQLGILRQFLLDSANQGQQSNEENTVQKTLHALCDSACMATGGILAVVLQPDEYENQLKIKSSSNDAYAALINPYLAAERLSQYDNAIQHQFIRKSDTLAESDRQLLESIRAEGLILTPIISTESIQGILLVFLRHSPLFLQDDMEILMLLGRHVSITLENDSMVSRLYRYSQQLEREITEGIALYEQSQIALAGTEAYAMRLDYLNEMSQEINTATDEEAIFKVAGSFIQRILTADTYSIFMAHEDPDKLIVALTSSNDMLYNGRIVPSENTISGEVLRTGQIKNIADLKSGMEAIHPDYVAALEQAGLQSMLAVPICMGQKNIGVIGTGSKEPDAYQVEDENILLHIASFVAVAVENLRRNQELQQAILIAEKASRAKSEFLATMSHELRTPLNGILGYVQIMRKDRDITPKQREGLEIIDRSSEHLLTLINDILDLSKIEAERMELVLSSFNLTDMINSVCSLVQVRAQTKELIFRYEQLTDLPVAIKGDEMRLKQILLNLLGNAVKYTDQGGVILKVGYHLDRIRFQIEDTGPGIEAETLKMLFQPFQQAERNKSGIEGTGLGLAISSKLILLMGGRLQVKSQPGEGSTFWFDLELEEDNEFATPPVVADQNVIGYEGIRRKVLIVDDRMENRAVLSGMLLPLGFDIQEAVNGQDCLERAELFRPNIILMDLRMPVLNGLETMRRIRQNPTQDSCKMIAISASAFEHDAEESREAGADDFLPKPFRFQKLLYLLGNHLNLRWITDHAEPEPEENTAYPVIPPSESVLKDLFDLARQGDVQSLLNASDRLTGEGLTGFAMALRSMAQNFKLKELRQFIEEYRNQSHERS